MCCCCVKKPPRSTLLLLLADAVVAERGEVLLPIGPLNCLACAIDSRLLLLREEFVALHCMLAAAPSRCCCDRSIFVAADAGVVCARAPLLPRLVVAMLQLQLLLVVGAVVVVLLVMLLSPILLANWR